MDTPRFRYWIECDLTPLGPQNSSVVDFTKPIGGAGEGFESVFTGSFEECDAWLDAHPEVMP